MNDAIQDTLTLIEEFRRNPADAISVANIRKGGILREFPVVRSTGEVESQIALLGQEVRSAMDALMARLDQSNAMFAKDLRRSVPVGPSMRQEFRPIRRCGLYVPRGLPSTAYTYLSAAKAAGVGELVVYVAQEDDGLLDSAVCRVARHYGAQIWGGPARYGFPALAFGVPAESAGPCDLICGPCGNKLNVLKQVCCLVAGRAADMGSGASELAILADSSANCEQVLRDALSQLEHGPDSKVHLVIVGAEAFGDITASPFFSKIQSENRIETHLVKSIGEGMDFLNTVAPETVELWLHSAVDAEAGLYAAGIVYHRRSSSLGDYAAIGRGCGDPTGGLARAQSGISPLTFLRLMPVVTSAAPDQSLVVAAIRLAHYEHLSRHEEAIRGELVHVDDGLCATIT